MGVRRAFLDLVDQFHADFGSSDHQLSIAATRNHKHLSIIRSGGSVTLATLEKIEDFMADVRKRKAGGLDRAA